MIILEIKCVMPFLLSHNLLYCVSVVTPFRLSYFNYQLQSYFPKRIHFGSQTYKMTLNLARMDWISAVHFDSK